MADLTKEQHLYDALKRLASYQSPEWLRKNSQKKYGLDADEAIEMAYDNMRNDAKTAIHGLRRPQPQSVTHREKT